MFLQLLSTLLSVLSLSFPILQNYLPIGSLETRFVPPSIFGTTTASSASIVLSLIVVVRWSGTLFELTGKFSFDFAWFPKSKLTNYFLLSLYSSLTSSSSSRPRDGSETCFDSYRISRSRFDSAFVRTYESAFDWKLSRSKQRRFFDTQHVQSCC